MSDCTDIEISNNSISENNDGIFGSDIFECSIIDNYFFNNFDNTISINFGTNNIIFNNTITTNEGHIEMYDGATNIIKNNIFLNINNTALHLDKCNYDYIIGNQFIDTEGLYLLFSSNLTISNNDFVNCGVTMDGKHFWNFIHEIPQNNMVNGKPLIYYKNTTGVSIHGDSASQVFLMNCSSINVDNIDLLNTEIGFSIFYSKFITISNCSISNSRGGFFTLFSDNIYLYDNKIINNTLGINFPETYGNDLILKNNYINSNEKYGARLYVSNSTISNNIVTENVYSYTRMGGTYGIGIYGFDNEIYYNNFIDNNYGLMLNGERNKIFSNNFESNGFGIYTGAKENYYYSNNIIDNKVYDNEENNSWDKDGKGNYWSDYDGADENLDGIGDTPYYFTDNQDNYPLMSPNPDVPEIEINIPPTCTINSPSNLETVNGIVLVSGSAFDEDGSIELVEIKINDGDWVSAKGTNSWTYSIDTTYLDDAEYKFYARSYDGSEYSSEAVVAFIINNENNGNNNNGNNIVEFSFDPLIDGFSFDNPGWTSSCGSISLEEAILILESDEFINYLEKGLPGLIKLTIIYLYAKATHLMGHCYGMTTLAMKYYYDEITKPSNSITYELTYDQVASKIEYYQSYQNLNINTYSILQTWGKEDTLINNNNQWNIIKKSVEKGEPIIIGLDSSISRHAVIGYGINEDGNVLIYDPSYPATIENPIKYIEMSESNSQISIEYQWEDKTKFDSWAAINYKQPDVVEWYFEQLENSLVVKADCPVELQTYDNNENELGDIISDGETHMSIILTPSHSHYVAELTGTDNGNYELSIIRIFNNEVTYQNTSGLINKSEIILYYFGIGNYQITIDEIKIIKPQEQIKEDEPFDFNLIIVIIVVVVIVVISIAVYFTRVRKADVAPLPPKKPKSKPKTGTKKKGKGKSKKKSKSGMKKKKKN
jgi:nitrous oxidase accessory protein NosD